MALSTSPSSAQRPVEWMRIFATRVAQQRADLSADEAVRLAIRAFQVSGHLQPEQAADRAQDSRGAS
ncbi:MAG TPA: hypothetical protein VNU48_09755 [Burkholderiaceae bacterium]|nr:hypothetical protein [Burkholderiaceae bacterium]